MQVSHILYFKEEGRICEYTSKDFTEKTERPKDLNMIKNWDSIDCIICNHFKILLETTIRDYLQVRDASQRYY